MPTIIDLDSSCDPKKNIRMPLPLKKVFKCRINPPIKSDLDLVHLIIDEISLEGLDGITFEALWTRISITLKRPLPFPPHIEQLIWDTIKSNPSIQKFRLPKPRSKLVIFNRYQTVDPDLGIVIDPAQAPEDIYPYQKIKDTKSRIMGSCKDYETRKDLTNKLKKRPFSKLVKSMDFVMVASQKLRKLSLFNRYTEFELELTDMQYAILERIGRSRRYGEITQGKVSLQAISKDARMMFYNRKILLQKRIISKQLFYVKTVASHNVTGSLFHLVRFYYPRRTKSQIITEEVIRTLKEQPDYHMEYLQLKKMFGLTTTLTKAIKTPEFLRFLKTELVPYRTMYPTASIREWRDKKGNERKIRIVKLLDPNLNIAGCWEEDDVIDEAENGFDDDDLNSNIEVSIPVSLQIYKLVLAEGLTGFTLQDVCKKIGMDYYTVRTFLKHMVQINLICTTKTDAGRQRVTRYAACCLYPQQAKCLEGNKKNVPKPTKSRKKSTKSTKKPTKATVKPTKSTKKNTKSAKVDTTTKSIKEDTTTKSTKKSTKSAKADTNTKSTKKNTKLTKTDTKLAKVDTESINADTNTNSTKPDVNPKSTKKNTKTTKADANTYTKSTKADTNPKSAKKDTKSTKTATKPKSAKTDTNAKSAETDTKLSKIDTKTKSIKKNTKSAKTDTNIKSAETDTTLTKANTNTKLTKKNAKSAKTDTKTKSAKIDTNTKSVETDTKLTKKNTKSANTDTKTKSAKTDTNTKSAETDTKLTKADTNTKSFKKNAKSAKTDTKTKSTKTDTNTKSAETDTKLSKAETVTKLTKADTNTKSTKKNAKSAKADTKTKSTRTDTNTKSAETDTKLTKADTNRKSTKKNIKSVKTDIKTKSTKTDTNTKSAETDTKSAETDTKLTKADTNTKSTKKNIKSAKTDTKTKSTKTDTNTKSAETDTKLTKADTNTKSTKKNAKSAKTDTKTKSTKTDTNTKSAETDTKLTKADTNTKSTKKNAKSVKTDTKTKSTKTDTNIKSAETDTKLTKADTNTKSTKKNAKSAKTDTKTKSIKTDTKLTNADTNTKSTKKNAKSAKTDTKTKSTKTDTNTKSAETDTKLTKADTKLIKVKPSKKNTKSTKMNTSTTSTKKSRLMETITLTLTNLSNKHTKSPVQQIPSSLAKTLKFHDKNLTKTNLPIRIKTIQELMDQETAWFNLPPESINNYLHRSRVKKLEPVSTSLGLWSEQSDRSNDEQSDYYDNEPSIFSDCDQTNCSGSCSVNLSILNDSSDDEESDSNDDDQSDFSDSDQSDCSDGFISDDEFENGDEENKSVLLNESFDEIDSLQAYQLQDLISINEDTSDEPLVDNEVIFEGLCDLQDSSFSESDDSSEEVESEDVKFDQVEELCVLKELNESDDFDSDEEEEYPHGGINEFIKAADFFLRRKLRLQRKRRIRHPFNKFSYRKLCRMATQFIINIKKELIDNNNPKYKIREILKQFGLNCKLSSNEQLETKLDSDWDRVAPKLTVAKQELVDAFELLEVPAKFKALNRSEIRNLLGLDQPNSKGLKRKLEISESVPAKRPATEPRKVIEIIPKVEQVSSDDDISNLNEFMGPNPIVIKLPETEDNIKITLIISTQSESHPPIGSKYDADPTIIYRTLLRANFIIDTINEEKIVTDIFKITKMIRLNESNEGRPTVMDQKSLDRIYARLIKDGYIKIIKVCMRSNNVTKSKSLICHPSVDINHSLITSELELLKLKFFSRSHKKKKVATRLSNSIFAVADVSESIGELKSLFVNRSQNRYPFSRGIGRKYGYCPKFLRMKAMHEFLFYLIYDFPHRREVTDVAEFLVANNIEVTDQILAEIPTIYNPEVGWKIFIPPLPKHAGWPEGWALLCDVLLCLPLSIFVQIFNVSYMIPMLPEYLADPIKRYLLVKQLPVDIKNGILFERKYVYVIHELLMRLCYMGVLQFGPQKLREKDQVFFYLNRNASLLDTTTTKAGYHQVTDLVYTRIEFTFKTSEDVDKYWCEFRRICERTGLGQRNPIAGEYITLQNISYKPAMLEVIKPTTQDLAPERDLGEIPGDHRGAGGLDSGFWGHIRRNWVWTGKKPPALDPIEMNQPPLIGLRKEKLGQTVYKPISFKDHMVGIECRATMESLHTKGLEMKMEISDGSDSDDSDMSELFDKIMKERVYGETKVAPRRKERFKRGPLKNKKIVVRKIIPRRMGYRREYYDDLDRRIMRRLGKNRADWSIEEDRLLRTCRRAATYLCPFPKKRTVPYIIYRDILHTLYPDSRLKTSRSCQRRLHWLLKVDEDLEVPIVIPDEIETIPFVQKYFGSLRDKIIANEQVSDEEIAAKFLCLVSYIVNNYGCANTDDYLEGRDNLEDFEEQPDWKDYFEQNQKDPPIICYYKPRNVDDIQREVIKSVIHSSLACKREKTNWSYQLFKIYQHYSNPMLKSAMLQMRDKQMITITKRYLNKNKQFGGMASSPFRFSALYIVAQLSKYSQNFFKQSHAMLLGIHHHKDILQDPSKNGIMMDSVAQGHNMGLVEMLLHVSLSNTFIMPEEVLVLNPLIEDHSEIIQEIVKRFRYVSKGRGFFDENETFSDISEESYYSDDDDDYNDDFDINCYSDAIMYKDSSSDGDSSESLSSESIVNGSDKSDAKTSKSSDSDDVISSSPIDHTIELAIKHMIDAYFCEDFTEKAELEHKLEQDMEILGHKTAYSVKNLEFQPLRDPPALARNTPPPNSLCKRRITFDESTDNRPITKTTGNDLKERTTFYDDRSDIALSMFPSYGPSTSTARVFASYQIQEGNDGTESIPVKSSEPVNTDFPSTSARVNSIFQNSSRLQLEPWEHERPKYEPIKFDNELPNVEPPLKEESPEEPHEMDDESDDDNLLERDSSLNLHCNLEKMPPTHQKIVKALQVTYGDKLKRLPRSEEIAGLLTRRMFPQLNYEEKVAKINKHFSIVCPSTNLRIPEKYEEVEDFQFIRNNMRPIFHDIFQSVQQNALLPTKMPKSKTIHAAIRKRGGNEADKIFADELALAIHHHCVMGATVKQLMERFPSQSGNIDLLTMLAILAEIRVILRVGVTHIVYVHFAFKKDWSINTCWLTREDRFLLASKRNDVASNEAYTEYAKTLKSYTERKVIVKPWIRIDGTVNYRAFESWLTIVMSHCLTNPNQPMTNLIAHFCFFKPFDLYCILEYLQKLKCVTLLAYRVKEIGLFTTITSLAAHPATIADEFDDIYIEIEAMALTKLGAFLNRKLTMTEFPFLPVADDA